MSTSRVEVPRGLAESAALSSAESRRWLAALPDLVAHWCGEWSLLLDRADPPRHGTHALVVPVVRRGTPFALKLKWPGDDTAGEAAALRRWRGQGAVLLLDSDESGDVLLLERLRADRTLHDVDLLTAAGIAGGLIRELAVAAPAGIAPLTATAAYIAESAAGRQAALGNPLPQHWVRRAIEHARALAQSADERCWLVHGDLGYGNVLAGERRPWLAIDPKPTAGQPERSVPELLWTRLDEVEDDAEIRAVFDAIVAGGQLDADMAWAWVVTRAVDYWLWGLSVGLTEDPARCRRLLQALLR